MQKRKHISIAAVGAAMLLWGCQSADAQWTGCGIGAVGGVTAGLLKVAPPIGIGADGLSTGGLINCDYRTGAFVLGAEASYTYFLGDIKKLNINWEYALTGRVGVLINSQNLLYAHAGWGQVDTDALGKINQWKIGLGDEFRIPNSPIYLDARYNYVTYDVSDWTSKDANSHQMWVILKLKFGPGMFGGKGDIFDTTVPCDPKLGDCKR